MHGAAKRNELWRDRLPQAGQWSWLLLCFLLPISGRAVPLVLVLSIVLVLLSAIGKPLRYDRAMLWPLFAFYLWHVVGMAWSTDIAFGLFDLQIKLGLVLLPIAAAVLVQRDPAALRKSMLAFTAGSVVAIILSLWKASVCFGEFGWKECWTQSYLSFDLHPSYAAWYTCWAILYWGRELILGRCGQGKMRNVLLATVPVLLVFTVLLASKSGLLGLGLVLAHLLFLSVRRLEVRTRTGVLAGGAMAVLLGVWFVGPIVQVRMGAAVDAVRMAMTDQASIYASSEGNEERLVAWSCSAELLGADPLGAGTGDVKHALVACYEARGAHDAAERRLNSHSQVLQGGVALGWIGLVLALSVALVPLWIGSGRKQTLLVLFAALFLMNAAIESVLEVQAGVVFVGLFLGLLAKGGSNASE